MTTFPTLPTGPFEHVSMDYARLRDEGLSLLGRLAGAQWTDFNTHDPGITILEQLCYAITDLGYRIAYPMPELLAGGDPGLPGPEAIFPSDPVTPADLRKAALDVDGIGNAWVEDVGAELAFYYDAPSAELRLRPGSAITDAAPVQMRGLHRVVVQTTEEISGEAALPQVATRLHAGRGLGSDLALSLVGITPVDLQAALEIGVVDDPARLQAEIFDAIESCLAPSARFLGRADAAAQGRSLEDILEGPLLAHGFVDRLPAQQRTVYVSDLLHAILDVPAVKAVRSLVLRGAAASGGWSQDLPVGTVATLAPAAELTLFHDGLPLRVDPDAVRARREELRTARATAVAAEDLLAPSPRQRDLTRYRSIQYQLPAAYGVGPLGLPSSATPERRAEARQLAAYLLIFDQLFASALAQLAHAGELLSPAGAGPRTYFAPPVDDARLGLDELRLGDPATHRSWLDAEIETGDPLVRCKRFLAHLLARFAEELGDHARPAAPAGSADDLLVAERRALLRDYPRLSRARGSGYDLSRHGTADAVPGGYEDRLRTKLGLRDPVRLHVVEHVLLRPVVEDQAQLADEGDPQVPLLAGVAGADPWSLAISVVLQEPAQADDDFEQFVVQTVAAETPAHLTVRLHWFGATGDVDDWAAFESAWDSFRTTYRTYRETRFQGATMPVILQLRLRDARDRVVDALSYVDAQGQQVGLGRTYPLRDLPMPERIVVAPGGRAKIELAFSQTGVTYQLYDRDTGVASSDAGAAITVDGTGGPIELVSSPIDVDTSYRILAVKRDGAQTPELRRAAWLRTAVRVVEGVDASLAASIRLPVLDSRIDNPRPGDARLGDWGVQAEVEIPVSQEGVTYTLIEDAADLSDVTRHRVVSAQDVVGTSGRIVLRTVAIQEDIDLRIRGQKTVGAAADPSTGLAILEVVLPLRVRANPAVPAQLVPSVVAYGGASVLRLGTTQASAAYRVHRRRVRDADFVFDAGAQTATIDVSGDGRTVRVQRPAQPAPWQDLAGFAPVGDAVAGNGGALDLAIGAPGTDDAFLLVQATKQHQTGRLGTGSAQISSAVQLDAALALLARPNPAPALHLEVGMAAGATTGSLGVTGGQPGVFYEFRLDGQTDPIPQLAYFHQRDDRSDQLNKGIGQLRIGVDAVVPRDRPVPAGDPVTTPPAAPLLDTALLSAGSVLRVVARKAMSGLTAPLDLGAVLDDLPAVTVPAPVARGTSADIVIETSRQGERYALTQNGQPVGDVQVGSGARIALPTGAVAERTVFTLVATRPDGPTLAVERHVEVTVDVAADPTDSGAGSATDSGAGSGAGSATDSGAGSATDSGAGSATDSGAGSATDSGAGSATDSGAGSAG